MSAPQFQNKQTAMRILKARIFEYEQEKKEQELKKHTALNWKKKIEWGKSDPFLC